MTRIATFALSVAVAAALSVPVGTLAAQKPLSTMSLSHYQRNDQLPVTQINIDASPRPVTPLSPFVFGNFLEHLDQLVDKTLGADPLINPNLERSDPQQTEPPYWDDSGSAKWIEDGKGYESPSYLQLSAPDGTVSQQCYLPVGREQHYTLTLFTRGTGQLQIALHSTADLASVPVIQATVAASSTGWAQQTIHWTIPSSAIAVGQQVRLAVTAISGGPVDVDWIELFPDDNIDHMDPDVIQLAKAWDIPILRLAGNFSSGYNWRDGIGPYHARPTLPNPAWHGPESNQSGTDEFLELCRLIGAVPQIGVNAGNGTAPEAAAWVRYCDSVKLRVPIWEVGNELYGPWQIGHTDPAGYAARYVDFRNAMLQANPHLQLIANGQGNEFNADGLSHDRAWNLALLQAATASGGAAPAWLSIHPLVGLPGMANNASFADEWQSAMAHPWYMDQTLFPELQSEILGVEGPNAVTRIAPTEWGIIISGSGWQTQPNDYTIAGAVYNALALNAYLRDGDWVTLANMTALIHGGCIEKQHGVVYADPQYYTDQLYSRSAPRIPVETTWAGPGADVPQLGGLPAASNVPDVDVFSALTADKQTLVVYAVNHLLTGTRPIHIRLTDFSAQHVSATILTAADSTASNSWDHPKAVSPQPFAVPSGSSKSGWSVTLPAMSVVLFTFKRA